jgi:hypothetical protein
MRLETYNTAFYGNIAGGSYYSAKHVIARVLEFIPVSSMLDVGCGVGSWLKGYEDLTKSQNYTGVDGAYVNKKQLLIDPSHFVEYDLTKPLDLGKKFDMVMTMEVAEHIQEQYADTFVASLTRHSDKILFSAALPGQGGTYHVNEQFPEYWAKKFAAHDYVCVDCIRSSVWRNQEIETWYRQNALLFIHKDTLPNYPALKEFAEKTDINDLTRINPDIWLTKTGHLKSWRAFAKYKNYHLENFVKSFVKNLIGYKKK